MRRGLDDDINSSRAPTLADVAGTIVLVGAARWEERCSTPGWRSASPASVVVIERSRPRADRAQLARLKLNPLLKDYVRFPDRDRGQPQVAPVVVRRSRLCSHPTT